MTRATRIGATVVLALFILATVAASVSFANAGSSPSKSSTQQGNTKSKRGRG